MSAVLATTNTAIALAPFCGEPLRGSCWSDGGGGDAP